MKLVFLTDAWQPLVGGGQKLYWEVLSRLAKDYRCQITVVTRALRYQGKDFNRPETHCQGRLNIVRLSPALSFFNPLGRFWFTLQSFFYCLKFKPDVFLGTTWLPALTLQLLKLFKKTPLVLLAIGFGSRFPWLENLISKRLNYDLVITDDWGLKPAKFITNGVTLPKKLSIKKYSQFTFLTIARNEPRKGIGVLKQAFKIVKKQFPGCQLHLFGPGFKTLSQAGLDKEMFQAHCLVIPSLAEGHPLILFEAWAHQLPIIATQVGSIPRFVNQDNGYLVTSNDAPALARNMKLAMQNPSLAVMGENGYQLVKTKYSWDKTARRYYQTLARLLA